MKKSDQMRGGATFVDRLCYFCLVLLCFHAHLFVNALRSPAGKGLRDFMLSLSDNNQADVAKALNSTSRYLDDLLNIDHPFFNKW